MLVALASARPRRLGFPPVCVRGGWVQHELGSGSAVGCHDVAPPPMTTWVVTWRIRLPATWTFSLPAGP